MRGILFKPDMIRAIINGSKVMTRRVIKPQPPNYWDETPYIIEKTGFMCFHGHDGWGYKKPRYQVGEVVYIKEAIHRFNMDYASYNLDYTPVMFLQSANRFHWQWKKDYLSPLHLPHSAARYFIRITDVRAEKLNNMTEDDAIREGVENMGQISAVVMYAHLWNSINKNNMWSSNPWCFVYSFERTEK